MFGSEVAFLSQLALPSRLSPPGPSPLGLSWESEGLSMTPPSPPVVEETKNERLLTLLYEFIIFKDSPTGKNPDQGGLHREVVRK